MTYQALEQALRQSPQDKLAQTALADYFEEQGWANLAEAARWCVCRGKWPRPTGRSRWEWRSNIRWLGVNDKHYELEGDVIKLCRNASTSYVHRDTIKKYSTLLLAISAIAGYIAHYKEKIAVW